MWHNEWLSAGDAGFNATASARLNALVENAPIPVIASHSPERIAKVCNRAIRPEHGKSREEFDPRPAAAGTPA